QTREYEAAILPNARRACEAERRFVEIGGAAFRHRHGGEAAVGVEAPAVIATGQPRRVALALVGHLGAAVSAAIEQHIDAAVAVADHDYGLTAELDGDVIAGVRHLALVADEQPRAAEDALHFELEQLGIGVDAAVHATGLDQPGDLVSVAHAIFLGMRPQRASLRRLVVGAVLHVHVDEIERRGGLLEHAPALE